MKATTHPLSNRIRANYPFAGFRMPKSPALVLQANSGRATAKKEITGKFKWLSYLFFKFLIQGDGTPSAYDFVPLLKDMPAFDKKKLQTLFADDQASHVFMDNDLLKVTLIYWPVGKQSKIHGHPKGGCILKVLSGKIEEKRYAPSMEPELLSTSTYDDKSMAYIDDSMAYHAVGNPFNEPAISLHIYVK